jgi:predicted Zn-dependent protease
MPINLLAALPPFAFVMHPPITSAPRYDDARRAFATQYRFPPDSPSAYLLAARMMLRREYLPTAESTAQKALTLNPNLPMAHLLLGQI